MAISNKTGRMLLTTGNKSEMAVGYATLYGDMAGGFAPIKDCSKLLVYRLARYRNTLESPVIPQRVIEREPSAELRPDQKDTDSLPPYEVLDPILEAFIEEDLSVEEICERGFDRAVVARVLDMVKRAEYKRRQAPPGVRVSAPRLRPRLALSDHQRLPALRARGRAQPPPANARIPTSVCRCATRHAGVVGSVDALARWRPDRCSPGADSSRRRMVSASLLGRGTVVVLDDALGALRRGQVGAALHVLARDVDFVLRRVDCAGTSAGGARRGRSRSSGTA